jgi:hypothetical protein
VSRPFLDYPAPLREALAVHEAFRKLGFTSDQIYIHRNPEPLSDIVVVIYQHGKSLATTLGRLEGEEADWRGQWKELVERFNAGEIDTDFDAFYEQSYIRAHYVDLLFMLNAKGIEPPYNKD